MNVGNSQKHFKLLVQLHSFVILNTVNTVIHVGRLKGGLSGKGIMILVSSTVLLRYKLRLHIYPALGWVQGLSTTVGNGNGVKLTNHEAAAPPTIWRYISFMSQAIPPG